jgi:hypothetical protein
MEHLKRDSDDPQAGTGSAAEAQLEPLAVLIEYYEREMGELPGRLMIAISFLSDAQQMSGWEKQPLEIRQAIEQAQALVTSVMSRILKAQHNRAIADPERLGEELFS